METKAFTATDLNVALTPTQLLEHWQGHRSLTRRVIEAFPEDQLFSFSIGGMRSFGEIAKELLQMAAPGAHGVATGEWKDLKAEVEVAGLEFAPTNKKGILAFWDWSTDYLNTVWQHLKPGRFQEKDVAFGQYEGIVWWLCFYFVDNEIHHRGQGYVYLRALGIEPPPFWEH